MEQALELEKPIRMHYLKNIKSVKQQRKE